MKQGKIRNRHLFFLTAAGVLLSMILLFLPAASYAAGAEAAEWKGYQNPGRILISYPKNGQTTTASQISILGASDYRYPLYMNGKKLETTSLGFFTVYVNLKVGENQFTFTNNEKTTKLTVIRKQSSGGGSSAKAPVYKAYAKDTYGVITTAYAKPRVNAGIGDLTMPLTKGTTLRILGEKNGDYRLSDGTYMYKGNIKTYQKKLPANKVKSVTFLQDPDKNVVTARFNMNINALYHIEVKENKIMLKLFDTVSAGTIELGENELFRKVDTLVYEPNKAVYYALYPFEDAVICGYDVFFDEGGMRLEFKTAPVLKEDSLAGATVLIDAGHGDQDTGTLGAMATVGPVEKDTNLRIALFARDYLEERGAKVVMVRSDDTFYTLDERIAKIRSVKPDISVSVHGNAVAVTSDFSKASGLRTHYTYNLFSDVPSAFNESLCEYLNFTPAGTKKSNLALTRLTNCPALLIETSFLSNPQDYEYLIQEENQIEMGNAIGNAVEEYLLQIGR